MSLGVDPQSQAPAYLIAGASGMLGTALQRVLTARGARFVAPSERDFDITDQDAVASRVADFLAGAQPSETGVLVNAAAYTNVERAEDDAATAYRVNEYGARVLAEAARRARMAFVHVSTDFVFDGTKEGAYAETDPTNPLSVYGASKLAGEDAVLAADPAALIVRTAWLFGPAGVNFPVKILEAARTNQQLQVVSEEVGSPTYTLDLAAGVVGLVGAGASGLYHLAGLGSCSRYELACEVLRLAGVDIPVVPVAAGTFPMKAARPLNSVLDCSKAAGLGIRMPPWKDALARFVASDVPPA